MGASYLIDTHVVVWLLDEGFSGTASTGEVLKDKGNTLIVSSVTAFEVALKVRLGKLEMARELVRNWSRGIRALDARELSLTSRHGLAAGDLDWGHHDPFDRLLVAQAQVEDLTLVTGDRVMLAAPGINVLPW